MIDLVSVHKSVNDGIITVHFHIKNQKKFMDNGELRAGATVVTVGSKTTLTH